MKLNLLARCVVTCVVLLSGSLAGVAQQKLALPMVSFAEVPLYPPIARVANVQGVVHLTVTTDGHRVVSTQVQDGAKVLADAAEKNAQSWKFNDHQPTSFAVTYVFKLVTDIKPEQNNPRIILRLPTEVEIDEQKWPGTRDEFPTIGGGWPVLSKGNCSPYHTVGAPSLSAGVADRVGARVSTGPWYCPEGLRELKQIEEGPSFRAHPLAKSGREGWGTRCQKLRH